ncbi:hypothetical protein B0T13DRAFT_116414 [Neurospora crassa]|nr:hypothetical protein B0T13DRAFT_116414 [Neurospora crassa]
MDGWGIFIGSLGWKEGKGQKNAPSNKKSNSEWERMDGCMDWRYFYFYFFLPISLTVSTHPHSHSRKPHFINNHHNHHNHNHRNLTFILSLSLSLFLFSYFLLIFSGKSQARNIQVRRSVYVNLRRLKGGWRERGLSQCVRLTTTIPTLGTIPSR